MITFSWSIDEMLRAPENGHEHVVTLIRWTMIARTEDGREETVSGALTPPMPEEGAEFTPYQDLTRHQVEGWLEAMPQVPDLRVGLANLLNPQPLAAPVAAPAPLPWEE